MKTYIVGNWKMNQTLQEVKEFFSFAQSYRKELKVEAWVSPQYIHLPLARELAGNFILIGAQNSSHMDKGAMTGEVSPISLAEMGMGFTIIGHSERRIYFKEDHALINKKIRTALEAGLKIIFCVGETEKEREEGRFYQVVEEQVLQGLEGIEGNLEGRLLLAYEPVWAIGTGKVATPLVAQEMHSFIRGLLQKRFKNSSSNPEEIPLLYGGSVKPSNIRELLDMRDIHGALVGGASLKAPEFFQICENAV